MVSMRNIKKPTKFVALVIFASFPQLVLAGERHNSNETKFIKCYDWAGPAVKQVSHYTQGNTYTTVLIPGKKTSVAKICYFPLILRLQLKLRSHYSFQ